MSVTVTELPLAERFWSSRPVLDHVRSFARSRRSGPWSTLGVVLARAVASVEPNVMIPPIVGGPVSLNIFSALVGASGAGKGASEGAARDAVQFVDFNGRPIDLDELPLGSGEGVARTYRPAGTEDDEPNPRTRALFSVQEVDTLAALGSRQGATLLPELRKLYMGEQLGFNNAAKATRSVLPAHSYRASLVVGVQPAKAAPLLHDSDGGTPQRFVFLRVDDPDAPDEAPPTPEPFVVKIPRWGSDSEYLTIPDSARVAMDRHRLAILRGADVDPLDGHRMLARLKVAAGLTILDGRTIVDDEDWLLAGAIARESDRTRAAIECVLAERTREANRARAEAKADEAEIINDRADRKDLDRIRGAIIRCLERRGTATRKDLRNNLKANLRDRLDVVLSDLESSNAITFDGTAYQL
ncbi:hypothetical protein [Rhodococcus sp. Q]|uniref:hypothetical protein n=1 Tax=Rhodococcus sp. Q TaxID=2502252 RepID=UPI0010F70449|nr:hypothetical protein [Rhodococcus sp. Q]